MPYLMELDDAVKKIVSAIEKERRLMRFPGNSRRIVRAGYADARRDVRLDCGEKFVSRISLP